MRQPDFQPICGSGLGLRRRRSLLLRSCLGLFGWLRFWRFFRSLLRLDRNEFDFENERGIRPDRRSGRAALAVSEIGWNEELPLGAHRHELNRFRPTLNDAADGNLERFVPFVGTIELGV